ncbi:Eco57I restriction-modification methylase domain-containing protein [Dethiothermospora halolimnae]|uniref:Eco57I restriction-modification methylase domain-containing protein n=1 Tax=Dethiothermospora halolimnae TaxID=3114390 RepID=UPI003CCB9D60
MDKLKPFKKDIYRLLKEEKNSDTEGYINHVKTLLYYIGRVVLCTSLYRKNAINEKDFSDLVDGKSNKYLPPIFDKIQYNYMEKLSQLEKGIIIRDILKLDIKEIRQFSLGELYEYFITNKERKTLGQVYTPLDIIDYMINETVGDKEIIDNPYYKIIDPTCGGGYFLEKIYKKLYYIFNKNYNKIIEANPNIEEELKWGIGKFIIENNIWGTDIDQFAVFMSTITLLLKVDELEVTPNIYVRDILLEDKYDLFSILDRNPNFKNNKFDVVIGNPPYIGHKKIDKEYRKKLQYYYGDVYNNKSDIAFCFFKKGHNILKEDGKLIYIVSRYFSESPSAKSLRNFLKNNFSINKIIDFYGKKVFKGIGISPIIIKCLKGESYNNHIDVYKLTNSNKINNLIDQIENRKVFRHFRIKQKDIRDDGWILIGNNERKLLNKIINLGDFKLDNICNCNQGVITGCDKAFIVDKETIKEENLDKKFIKPWIKNSNIGRYQLKDTNKYILYTDLIDDIDKHNSINEHIIPYKDRLMKRRECLRRKRKWYQLQWGRDYNIFKDPKIIFPFKSEKNRFTIVYDEKLCSADIYIIRIKDEIRNKISLEYLLAFLNSSVSEFYFKCIGKKIGDNLYDYYPNKLMTLKLKVGDNITFVDNVVKRLISLYSCLKKYNFKEKEYDKIKSEIENLEETLETYFYELYRLSEGEIKIIKNNIT